MGEAKKEEVPERHSGLSGFLPFLRDNGVRVSTPEWMNFLSVIESIGQTDLIDDAGFCDMLKSIGLTTLVKDSSDIAVYSDAFDEFFRDMKQVHSEWLHEQQRLRKSLARVAIEAVKATGGEGEEEPVDTGEAPDESVPPDIKEQLGITEVIEGLNVDLSLGGHDDTELTHGGAVDQHNDILRRADKNKQGGGDGKTSGNGSGVATEKREFGKSGGGGKGKHIIATPQPQRSLVIESSAEQEPGLSKEIYRKDRREIYNVRPNRADVAEIVKNLRRVIIDVSETKSGHMNVERTVDNFAKKDFRLEYDSEQKTKPETVLLVDVGGPVDEWRPLMEELTKGMSRGLLKLEIYFFHNQLYGYVWSPRDGNYAKPNSLKSIREIVKKRKKVIIYGDADMADNEVEYDNYPPGDNEEKIARYEMDGLDCLKYIKRNSENVVWINPILRSSWYYDDYYDEYDTDNSVGQISDVIPMYDLSIGGVRDAITSLMKK
jgi:uncharacterized protein with von Willebrand factor type A (vWA) domain